MTPETLLRLYPPAWRERYGGEFVALLEKEGTGRRVALNVMAGAFDAWISPGNATHMAHDGSFGPLILWKRPADAETDLYSRSHWVHLAAAMAAGLVVHGIGQLVHPGKAFPINFLAGFMAGLQLWYFRRFGVRTRVVAFFWALVVMIGGALLIYKAVHAIISPWFGR